MGGTFEATDFQWALMSRMRSLSSELGQEEFYMPIGLLLVIDQMNGGDITAQELVRRFNLLDIESKNIIDFYFLGWELVNNDRLEGIKFNFDAYKACRESLKSLGIKSFGGNADLILLDAEWSKKGIILHFDEAIHIDLSRGVSEKDFPTLGQFLQSLVDAAEKTRTDLKASTTRGYVYHISDDLGIAIAKKSLLNFILEKWGNFIGAKKLSSVAIRNLAPSVNLYNFPLGSGLTMSQPEKYTDLIEFPPTRNQDALKLKQGAQTSEVE